LTTWSEVALLGTVAGVRLSISQSPLVPDRRGGLGAALSGVALGSTAIGDPWLLGAALAGLIANLALYGYVWLSLRGLPELMPLHYNGVGVVDLIGRPIELFKLPAICSAILLVNGVIAWFVHRSERPAAHLLVWTALVVQIVFASGAWILVRKAAGE
jgi:hypothetical protein